MEKNKKMQKTFTKEALLAWIAGDPFKEATLISKVPLKSSTLGRIKSGSYVPSERLKNAIMAIVEGKQ